MSKPEAAFPFPFAEDHRQTAWWAQLPPYDQRIWFPILRRMTPDERREFHEDRRATAMKYGLGADQAGGAFALRREHEEDLLRRYWLTRLAEREAA